MATTGGILLVALLSLLVADGYATTPVVTYDSRSLIINGSRELLFSGSIHYPRSTPDMWPGIIKKAKEGNRDLVRFIKVIWEQGLWVTLRIGPYIEAEWNMGGFPYWLREVPDIIFRSDNEPFKYHMKKYAEKVIDMMKKEQLFADQGGPIVMMQQTWLLVCTTAYLGSCANKRMPLPPSSSTCNGRQCADTFPGPNGPDKPSLWTENWTAQYRVFGDTPSQRAAEDISFAVARFFTRNGTLNNYYMYYGGSNFGRTSSSSFVTTRYYDEAPLDEYGLKREPKFGHLRDLHRALKLSKKPLLWGTQKVHKINHELEITTYEKPSENICVAFLTNNNTPEKLELFISEARTITYPPSLLAFSLIARPSSTTPQPL
ncbi:Beta-galactosidase 13 [Sesamum alatum]|uniref:beta-galactosidase n=1 Tax=Sesamum alatum TaxID=300844 RepID=A0AAE2CJ43_9LAMI|nr:Beta-galactosidase 13 [Sesamum alatum]